MLVAGGQIGGRVEHTVTTDDVRTQARQATSHTAQPDQGAAGVFGMNWQAMHHDAQLQPGPDSNCSGPNTACTLCA